MAYTTEGRDIIISGWENGVADTPYDGIADIRGFNTTSTAKEASIGYAQTLNSHNSLSLSITSADPATDIVTCTITSGSIFLSVVPMRFSGGSLPAGISASTDYWIEFTDATHFQVYTERHTSSHGATYLVNITGTGTGTGTSILPGLISSVDKVTGAMLDTSGRAWDVRFSNGQYQWLGNTRTGYTASADVGTANSLCWFKGYLFIFGQTKIQYIQYTETSTSGAVDPTIWNVGWNPATGSSGYGSSIFTTTNGHVSLVGFDDILYISDGRYLISLQEKVGTTFDPTNTATYTWNATALDIPSNDFIYSIAESGPTLLIGGKNNAIYPWDRKSPSFRFPILIAESGINKMLTVNTNTYISAGVRGNIYITNGAQAQIYKKIPDHITGLIDPRIYVTSMAFDRNQLFLGIKVNTNTGTVIGYDTLYAGLWAIDITTDSFRAVSLCSSNSAYVTAIWAANSYANNYLKGYNVYVAWATGSGATTGIDTTDGTVPTTYINYIYTDLINIGQYLTKRTLENVEFKLNKPLVSGEGIIIYQRQGVTDSWTQVGECTTVGAISEVFPVTFENSQWLQLKIQTKSTGSSPSYVPLREIRLR